MITSREVEDPAALVAENENAVTLLSLLEVTLAASSKCKAELEERLEAYVVENTSLLLLMDGIVDAFAAEQEALLQRCSEREACLMVVLSVMENRFRGG